MNNNMYKRSKMINYCLGDNTSDYIKKRNYYLHHINIDKIKNRKNKFLPKINSQRIILKSPKRRQDQQKIDYLFFQKKNI